MSIKIVYVDDEPLLCEIFQEQFSSDKVEILVFTDPKLAIEAVKNNPPHLIFLDFRLIGSTGDSVASLMPAEIPKFLITGDIDVRAKYKFNQILRKPIENSLVQEIINQELSRLQQV